MVKKSPEQVIFDLVFATSERLGFDTYDYLPANKVDYPFVFVGEILEEDRHTKSSLFGDLTITVHVYHHHKKRRIVTDMLTQIKSELFRIRESETLYVRLNRGDINLFIDDTMPEVLLHGICDLEFTFH